MSVPAVGPAPVVPVFSERMEGAGPDHDGDADDAGGVAQATQAPVAPGTGIVLDRKA